MNFKQYKNRFEKLHQQDLFKELTNIELVQSNLEFKDNTFSLSKKEFYFSKPLINLFNKDGVLNGELEDNDFKTIYLSYNTLNNRFNEPPEYSLIKLDEVKSYKFYITFESNKTLEIIPYIIHYSDKKKKKVTKVVNYGQTIDFKNYDQFRLTFKLIGHGYFKIKNISIIPEG